MLKSESVVNLAKALIAAKKKFAPVVRERENPGFKRDGKFSKYEDLAAVIDATDEALAEYGLVVLQFPQNDGDRVGVNTIILHDSGEFWGDSFTLPLATPNAQTGVGAITYARRAALKGVLGIAAEDDDGNKASDQDTQQRPTQTQRPTQAVKPAAAKASTATQTAKPTATPATPPEKSATSAEAKSSTTTSATVAATSAMPTAAEKDEFIAKFNALRDNLCDKTKGNLKARVATKELPALPVAIKLKNFMTSIEGVKTPNNMSREQWLDFFSRADHVAGLENGWVGLAKLVNKANGIEEEKK